MPAEKKRYPGKTVIWVLLVIGFMIFGLPFIYGFTIIMWAIMCVILLVAYLTRWGRGRDFVEGEQPAAGKK